MARRSHRSTRSGRLPAALLERDAEIATLAVALEDARAGEGRLVVVEGAAGIGKSRLLAEVRRLATDDGMQVLSARAGEHEAEFAFGVVRQLFEPRVATATAAEREELLAGAAALVEPLFSTSPGSGPDLQEDSSFAILHGLYWLAANIAYATPACLIVDDLHWADVPSLRWLGFFARRLEGLPLALVVGCRPAGDGQDSLLLADVLGDPSALVVQPAALTLGSVLELTETRLGLEPDETFGVAVTVATGGNPLYVTAVLDTISREGVEPTAEQARHVLELGPRAVARSVATRLTRMPPDAVAMAEAGAMLGDGGALRHAAALAGLDPVGAAQNADRLVTVDILRGADPIEFSHPVVRAAVYERIDAATRDALHRRAAAILAKAGAPPERAAAHLLQVAPVGDPGVVDALRDAAARALANGASATAVDYLGRALAEPPPEAERAEILLALGLAERRAGRPDAVAHLEAAWNEGVDPLGRARAGLELGRTLFFANRHADAIRVLQDVTTSVGDADPDLRERADAEMIGAARWIGEFYPLAAEHLAAVDEATLHGGGGTAQLLATMAVDEAVRCGSREVALRQARTALAMGVLADEEAIGYYHAINALFMVGETEEARGAYEQAAREARRRGDPFRVSNLLGFMAYIGLRLGRLRDAEADLREGLALTYAAAGDSMAFQWHAGTLADLLIERGEIEEATALVETAQLDEQSRDNMQLFFLRVARGRLRLLAREPEGALDDFRTIIDVAAAGGAFNPAWIPARSHAALALHLLGRDADATELAEEELGYAQAWGAPVAIAVSLRTLGLIRGGAAGLANLNEAVDMLEPTPARLEYARALFEHGAALRRSNHRIDARERLRSAADLGRRLGALALVEQANQELAATGARPRSVIQTGTETLTASELRVAQLAAEGMSNKEVAQALFLTVKTIEVHLSSVYRKLGITSRRALPAALLGDHQRP
ncbi:MAG TPA: AAA family ATPase [Gaiellales bacterium]|nr:AAA family ATPase [Gaiellales bacterium]